MKKLLSALLSTMLLLTASSQEKKDTLIVKPMALPAGFTAKINQVYTTVNGWNGRMDLYLPPASGHPAALVINIHGGGWNHGDKESQSGFGMFFNEGYAVANVEYRLVAAAPAPAAIEDIRCALIYLIRHAAELHIDPERIVIMGGSAGGHLALMGAYLENDHRFDGHCLGAEKIHVAGVIDKWGIADVWDWAYGKERTSKSAVNWLGTEKSNEAFAQSVSPNHYIKKSLPPTFIVHGDADSVVSQQQSVRLYHQLQEVGVKTDFISMPGGGHGKFTKEQNASMNQAILNFIKDLESFKKYQ